MVQFLSLITGDTYQTLIQNNYVSVLCSLVCKDFQMIPTGLHVCQENILISPSPFREVYVGATQQHETTLNRHFQEVRLDETKKLVCPVEYAVLSEQQNNGFEVKIKKIRNIFCYSSIFSTKYLL